MTDLCDMGRAMTNPILPPGDARTVNAGHHVTYHAMGADTPKCPGCGRVPCCRSKFCPSSVAGIKLAGGSR